MNAKKITMSATAGYPARTASGAGGFNPITILMRRRWQLFACLLLVCGMALASAFLARPKYHAASQIQLVSDSPDKLAGLTEMLGMGGQGDYFDTQCKLIKSRKVLSDAARRMNYSDTDWQYNDNVYEQMKARVQVNPISQSRMIEIIGEGNSPSEAAALANQVTAAFVEQVANDYKADVNRVFKRIEKQIVSYDQQIGQGEQLLSAFREEHQIAAAGQLTRMTEGQIASLERDLADWKMKKLELDSRKAELDKIISNPGQPEPGSNSLKEVAGNARITALDSQIRQLAQEQMQLERIYLPGHAKLKELRNTIDDLQTTRTRETDLLIRDLHDQVSQQLAGGQTRQESLSAMLKQQREENLKLSAYQFEFEKMVKRQGELTVVRDQLSQNLRKYEISENMKETPVVVVDSAHLPTKPIGLTAEHRAASILLLGLVFSVVFVLSIERLTTSEETESNREPARSGYAPWGWPGLTPGAASGVEENQALGRVGKIDYVEGQSDKALAARCRIVHIDPGGLAAGAFREASARLLSRFGRAHQSLALTGSSRGSGKTTCASNLALSIVQTQRRVALVDFNPLTSPLSCSFNYECKPLDLDMFVDNRSLLDSSLARTDVSHLTILPVDMSTVRNRSGAAAALPLLQAELTGRYDWVIYDAGVIGDTLTDLLLQMVGKALFISGDTDADGPAVALEQIENRGAVSIGYMENHPVYSLSPQPAVRV